MNVLYFKKGELLKKGFHSLSTNKPIIVKTFGKLLSIAPYSQSDCNNARIFESLSDENFVIYLKEINFDAAVFTQFGTVYQELPNKDKMFIEDAINTPDIVVTHKAP